MHPSPRPTFSVEQNPEKQNLKVTLAMIKEEKSAGNPKPNITMEVTDVKTSPQVNSSGKCKPLSTTERRLKIEKYQQKKKNRKWCKEIVYESRKKSAEKRVRVCGRFVDKNTERTIQKSIQYERKRFHPEKVQNESSTLMTDISKLQSTNMLPIIHSAIFAFTRAVQA